jgi:hypothetical protein
VNYLLTSWVAIRDAPNAILEAGGPEIDQQPHREAKQAQIGEQLLWMNRRKLLHRFQFDHNRIFNQHVDTKARIEPHSIIFKGNHTFGIDVQTSARKIASQNGLINGLEQSRPQSDVHLESGIGNRSSQSFEINCVENTQWLRPGYFDALLLLFVADVSWLRRKLSSLCLCASV